MSTEVNNELDENEDPLDGVGREPIGMDEQDWCGTKSGQPPLAPWNSVLRVLLAVHAKPDGKDGNAVAKAKEKYEYQRRTSVKFAAEWNDPQNGELVSREFFHDFYMVNKKLAPAGKKDTWYKWATEQERLVIQFLTAIGMDPAERVRLFVKGEDLDILKDCVISANIKYELDNRTGEEREKIIRIKQAPPA